MQTLCRQCCSYIVIASLLLTVTTASAGPLRVFVSILPQQFLVERVGGEHVNVISMVRPGFRPETYEPTPKQMAALSDAVLYFRIGVPFEDIWIDKIKSQNPAMRIVDCCESIKQAAENREPEHDHDDDRHIWTSPLNAIALAERIKSALIDADPENGKAYKEKFSALKTDLLLLDQYIRNALRSMRHRYFIVSHPAWGYFAETYDLEQIAIEQHGSEIRAKGLVELIELARRENVKTVFVQKQFNTTSAKVLARETGGRVVTLDPLAKDYIANLRTVTQEIVRGAE